MNKIQLGNITAYNDDYRNVIPLYENGYFDLLHDDPPYGIGADNPTIKPSSVKQKNGNILNVSQSVYEKKSWDKLPPNKEYFEMVFPKAKHQVIWGVNYFNYPLSGGRIVWDKLNGYSDQFDAEIAYCSFHKRIDMIYYMWAGMMQGKYCSDILQDALIQEGNKKLNEKRRHPTQKPLKLLKFLYAKYFNSTLPNNRKPRILICHGGSLNDAIVCDMLGFECVICEIDKSYFTDGINEIKWHQRQQTIQFV